MTKAADLIVTGLQCGPASARELSQSLDGVLYANVRQSLCRMLKAGVVTKIKHGVYQLAGCADSDRKETACSLGIVPNVYDLAMPEELYQNCSTASELIVMGAHVRACKLDCSDLYVLDAIELAWADFEAMNDPYDPRAWA